LVYVFLIYGLAFVALGLAIAVQPRHGTLFRLGPKLWLLAAFGALHGINEWIDMLRLLDAPGAAHLDLPGQAILALSFVFPMQFGLAMLRPRRHWVQGVPMLVFFVWALAVGVGDLHGAGARALARYVIGLPGIAVATAVLAREAVIIGRRTLPRPYWSLALAAVSFGAYGLLAGIFVEPAGFFPASVFNAAAFESALGFPVQVARTVCAVALAYNLVRVLRLFEWERAQVLERKVDERTAELRNAVAQVETLRGLLPICAWCKKIRDDEGYWSEVEAYIAKRSGATFTHGVCPSCAEKMLGDLPADAPRKP